jgi:hypothetical protein
MFEMYVQIIPGTQLPYYIGTKKASLQGFCVALSNREDVCMLPNRYMRYVVVKTLVCIELFIPSP